VSTTLPAGFPTATSLADVLTSCLAAISGEPGTLMLPQVDRAVVVLADGLGAHALRARAGHARTLAAKLDRASTITSGSPTTTSAALATLCTGATPGEHGLVGYRGFDPATGRVFNHLSGWHGVPDPATWQRLPTVFERARASGLPSYVIGPERYRDSSFTRAVLRGSEYLGADSPSHRARRTREVFDRGGKALVYLYVPELDVASHAHGGESAHWLSALEELDSAVATLVRRLGPREGALVTADHGAIDVPSHRHVLYDTIPGLVDGVVGFAGEPRLLQLHLAPTAHDGDAEALAEAWRAAEGHRSWVATRSQAIEAGWFGPQVDDAVVPRIGDVLIAARGSVAYYHSTRDDRRARAMVGQHGSLTPEEQRVPLLRFGAFG
jgi:predicted AlkP superfamily pyrophosphatase or phosphodiesterase